MATLDSPAVPFPESPTEQDDMVYPCKGCGEILEEGKAFELAGNRWHLECFRCNTCGTLLDSDANLLLLGDGSLICNNCTYSCNACGNKIEDLAILTGDQAYCSSCFRCRNCKRKIENLRYARTSQGIFCMSCHESLMARRRKKSKMTARSAPPPNGAAAAPMPPKEKALPSLPPGAVQQSETPVSDGRVETPGAKAAPERSYLSRKDVPRDAKREISPLSDDARGGDGQTLPASTYGGGGGGRRRSHVSQHSDDGEEQGYLPMTFDPTPGLSPMARREPQQTHDLSPPTRDENRLPRDYFGRPSAKSAQKDGRSDEQRSRSASADRERERTTNQARASPHILYQEKGRNRKRELPENDTPGPAPAVAPLPPANIPERSKERSKLQHLDTSAFPTAAASQNEGFKLGEVPKSKKGRSRSGSKAETRSPVVGSPVVGSPVDKLSKEDDKDKASSGSPTLPGGRNSGVNPFEDRRRNDGSLSVAAPVPPRHADRPVRGDSLTSAARKDKSSPPEQPLTPSAASAAAAQLQVVPDRAESRASSFADAQSMLARDNNNNNGLANPLDSPAVRRSLDMPGPRAPNRPAVPAKAGAAPDDFITTRPPPPPPPPPPVSADRHRPHGSITSLHSHDGHFAATPQSAGLPKHSMDSGFSMEEDLARIMRGEPRRDSQATEGASSVLRRVSNAVKHGRSFSDRGMGSAGGKPSGGADVSTPMTISSPIMSSPAGRDSSEAVLAQLRRAQQRIAELEAAKNGLEEKVNSSSEIKAATNELREKRTTMVILDTQREMVVRELEAMTEHLSRAKDSGKPLDLNSLQTAILKDFADSLQKLKDQMGAQIEELMHRRNQLTDEIGGLILMKDKGFQEYESLSNKNAQLLEMNDQILHNIQDMYKSNRGLNGGPTTTTTSSSTTSATAAANGLGIYSTKPETPGPSDARNMNFLSTDSSLPSLLHDNDVEGATLVPAPQVVNIRKGGQPKKFNWRKGGEKMAKNVTKGLKGAFSGRDGETGMYGGISVPYNQTQTSQVAGGGGVGSDQGSMNSYGKPTTATTATSASTTAGGSDPSSRGATGFGFFAQKNGGSLKTGGSGSLGGLKDNSSTNLAIVVDGSVLFGSELEDRCEFEKRMVPAIVSRCIEEVESRGMDVEGVYRKSGGSGQVKAVQQGFEREGSQFDISDADIDIHAVTSALKQYFRKLPTPLVTYDVYEALLEAGQLQEADRQVPALRAALAELPEHHRNCLDYLFQHLARVVAHEQDNLMTALNIAVVFAPTIMRPLSIEREMSDMHSQRAAVQALLEHHDVVFPDE